MSFTKENKKYLYSLKDILTEADSFFKNQTPDNIAAQFITTVQVEKINVENFVQEVKQVQAQTVEQQQIELRQKILDFLRLYYQNNKQPNIVEYNTFPDNADITKIGVDAEEVQRNGQ